MPSAVRNTQRKIVAGRGAHFFAVDYCKVRRVRCSHLGVGKRQIVIRDGEEREVRFLRRGYHLRQTAASTGSVGVNVNHSNPLAARRITRKTWQSGKESVKYNHHNQQANRAQHAQQDETHHLSFWGAIGVGFGVALRGSRSLIDRRHLLERGTQIVGSVPLYTAAVKQKAILLATLEDSE